MEPRKPSLWERFSPLLVVVTIILAFLVGVLWQQVNSLKGGGGLLGGNTTNTGNTGGNNTATAENRLSVEKLVGYAKELGLNDKDFKACLDSGEFKDKVAAEAAEGGKLGVTGTPAVFVNGRRFAGAFPFDIFKEVIDLELAGKGSSNVSAYSQTLQGYANSPQKLFDPVAVTVPLGDAPVLGEAGAKVTIIEYSDFECPFCSRFYTETLKQIKSQYVDTGKAKFVYKQFPLVSIHPNAQKAAEASLCAKKQGKFWEWHDKVFDVMSGS